MELFYRKYGQGKPVIILHGLFGSSDNWQSLAKRFSIHFEVFTPDLRNHGQSPHHKDINYQVMAADILQFIKAYDLGSTHVIGHSLGGKTAMYLALNYPGIIDKLVIVDIAPGNYDIRHEQYIESMFRLKLSDYTRREEIDKAMSADIKDPAIRQFLLKNLKRDPEGGFAWKINLAAIRHHLARLGEAISAEIAYTKPALFLAGERSDYITPSDELEIKRLFPNSDLITVENTGHWIHAEAPDRFYDIVTRFLKE